VVGRLYVEATGGQAQQAGPRFAVAPRVRPHEDAGQAPLQPGQLLCVGDRRDRYRAVDQWANFAFEQLRAEKRLLDAGADPQLHGLQRCQADRARDRQWQGKGLLVFDLRRGEAAQQWPAEAGEARVGAEQVDRLFALRSDHIDIYFQLGHRRLHAGKALHLPEQALIEALGAARGQL
jgi:hypothetical protein